MKPAQIVEIFRTNVQHVEDALLITAKIGVTFPSYEVNFDLEDCDRILRVKAYPAIQSESVAQLLGHLGFTCDLFVDDVDFLKDEKTFEYINSDQ